MSANEKHPISDFTQAALNSLRTMIDANSIIGDPITTGDGTVIIPISKVSFGYASGGSDLPAQKPDLFGGATGGGVTIQPLAFLVIHGDRVELKQIQTAENTGDRIVNAVPAVLDKLLDLIPRKEKGEKETDKAEPAAQSPSNP